MKGGDYDKVPGKPSKPPSNPRTIGDETGKEPIGSGSPPSITNTVVIDKPTGASSLSNFVEQPNLAHIDVTSEKWHLFYVAYMCQKALEQMLLFKMNGNWLENDFLSDLYFESFLTYYRCVYFFLVGKDNRATDIKLSDFGWTEQAIDDYSLSVGATVGVADALSQQVAHLTKYRKENDEPANKLRKEHAKPYWIRVCDPLKKLLQARKGQTCKSPAGAFFSWEFLWKN